MDERERNHLIYVSKLGLIIKGYFKSCYILFWFESLYFLTEFTNVVKILCCPILKCQSIQFIPNPVTAGNLCRCLINQNVSKTKETSQQK